MSRQAKKDLERVPTYIVLKLNAWVEAVENDGLAEVRKIPGFHDELLRGQRHGQHSVRLSKAYRAIYIISSDGQIECVEIKEVNKHEY